MTAKTGNTAVLTPSSPEHCFTVTVLQQPDEFDDRSFAFSVMLREGAAVEPSRNLIHLPTTDLEVTVQPCKCHTTSCRIAENVWYRGPSKYSDWSKVMIFGIVH